MDPWPSMCPFFYHQCIKAALMKGNQVWVWGLKNPFMLEETYNLGAEFFFTRNDLKILLRIIWKEGSYFAQRKKSLTLGIHSQAPFKALNLECKKGTLRLEPHIKALSKVLTFTLQCCSQEESLEPNYLFVGAISPGQLEVDVIDMHTSFWRGNGFGRWTITWNQSKYWKLSSMFYFFGY